MPTDYIVHHGASGQRRQSLEVNAGKDHLQTVVMLPNEVWKFTPSCLIQIIISWGRIWVNERLLYLGAVRECWPRGELELRIETREEAACFLVRYVDEETAVNDGGSRLAVSKVDMRVGSIVCDQCKEGRPAFRFEPMSGEEQPERCPFCDSARPHYFRVMSQD